MPGREQLPNWDQYATRWTALHGGVDPRRARTSVEHWQHAGYHLAKVCARLRIKPAAITFTGLLACLLVPAFVAHGNGGRMLAAGLVLFAAVADTVDGALAVVTSHATRLGYVYDSVVDRIAELCWLLALWRIGVPAYLVLIAGAMSWLHEYTRARANAAGMREIGASTLGERPTRVLLAFIGIALAGLLGLGSHGHAVRRGDVRRRGLVGDRIDRVHAAVRERPQGVGRPQLADVAAEAAGSADYHDVHRRRVRPADRDARHDGPL